MQTYIFIGFQYAYSKVCLTRYLHKENNFYYMGTGNNVLTNKIQKLHCCEFVNKYIDLPFKSIWFNDFSELGLDSKEEICFVFSKSQSWLLKYRDGLYIKKLKSQYSNCKVVLYLWDLISSYYKFDVDFFKSRCDTILTYDLGDSQKYQLTYCPVPYSKIDVEEDPKIEEFDVYFCGKAKNRLQDIFEVYHYLKQNHLSCHFFIMDVPRKQQKYREDITYNKRISYYHNLQYLQKARFVLDIVQKDSKGDTLRVKEAVTYGKKIITNNAEVKNNAYYSAENICVFGKVSDISKEFLTNQDISAYKNADFNRFEEVLADICKNNF